MTKCTDGGSVGTFLNDAFSSVNIPDGVYVKMCEHSANQDYGRCIFLYSDTPAFNSRFNNAMSYAQAYAYDPNNFQMIMASDSQLWWSKCDGIDDATWDPDGRCYQIQDGFGTPCVHNAWGIGACWNTQVNTGEITNDLHVQSINALKTRAANDGIHLAGVVMNGDLTNFGSKDGALASLVSIVFCFCASPNVITDSAFT
jgi:hypothetical protein